MPRHKPICPECGSCALSCVKTMPDDSEPLHYVELPRCSIWSCAVCGARFILHTPAGHLKKVRIEKKCIHGHE